MIELRDFIYELREFTQQTHILKDHFNKLTTEEKQKIMELAPEAHLSPELLFRHVFEWFETVEKAKFIPDDE